MATRAKGRTNARANAKGRAQAGGTATARQPRSDRKAPAEKYAAKMTLKFTPKGREELTRQAKGAGFDGDDSAYLRHLAAQDRKRLGLGEFAY